MFMEKLEGVKIGYDELLNQLSAFSSEKNHKDVNESIADFKVCRINGDENATIFLSDSKVCETCMLVFIIPYKKTYYKTRKIILRPDIQKKELKISLHEVLLNERESEESARKRKFRFYVRFDDIDQSFIEQCKKYLLNRISNQDLIKSVPRLKANGQELL
jgi:hypothetical protein